VCVHMTCSSCFCSFFSCTYASLVGRCVRAVRMQRACRERVACSVRISSPHQYTETLCNSLSHTATHCDTLRHTATHCNTLQHTTTHCNTLQHTTTHCNTPQHTAFIRITSSLQMPLSSLSPPSLSSLIFVCVHACSVFIN